MCNAERRQLLRRLWFAQRIAHADERLSASQQAEVGDAVFQVGAERADLHDDVGGLKHFLPAYRQYGPAFAIGGVGIPGGGAGTLLDDDLQPRLDKLCQRRGDECHTMLARERFLNDADFHGPYRWGLGANRPITDNLRASASGEFGQKLGGMRHLALPPSPDVPKPMLPPLNSQVANARLLNSHVCEGFVRSVPARRRPRYFVRFSSAVADSKC